MTPVLLDTHVLVWLMMGHARLGRRARQLIEKAAATKTVLVSAITPWEVAMLVAKERLVLQRDVGLWLDEALGQSGLKLHPLTPAISVESTRLPGHLHGDPADRIIAATARSMDATLVTDDERLLDYAASGHLKALKASG